MSYYGTNWLETEALIAAQDSNDDVLYESVVKMAAWERKTLRAACHKLLRVLDEAPFLEEIDG